MELTLHEKVLLERLKRAKDFFDEDNPEIKALNACAHELLCHHLLQIKPTAFRMLKPEHRSYSVSLKAVSLSIANLKYTDPEILDDAFHLELIEYFRNNTQKHVNTYFREMNRLGWVASETVYTAGIRAFSKIFKFVPLECRTRDLCQMAVRKNGNFIYHVPDEYKDYELCLAAFKKQGNNHLDTVPEVYRTEELCRLAVQSSLGNLRLIEDHAPYEDLIWERIKKQGGKHINQIDQNRLAVQQMEGPDKVLTLYRLASESFNVFKILPKSLRFHPDMLPIAQAQSHGDMLGFLPSFYFKLGEGDSGETMLKQILWALELTETSSKSTSMHYLDAYILDILKAQASLPPQVIDSMDAITEHYERLGVEDPLFKAHYFAIKDTIIIKSSKKHANAAEYSL